MEQKQYEENTRKIVELVAGMTDAQWSRVAHLINRCYDREMVKVSFEVPEHLDHLMDMAFIRW